MGRYTCAWQDGTPVLEQSADDFEDIEQSDSNILKDLPLYGFTYDETTNTYMPENGAIKSSVASSTIEIDFFSYIFILSAKNVKWSRNESGYEDKSFAE